MSRSRGAMLSPPAQRLALVSAALGLLAPLCGAGPLGPLPNVTISSSDLGLKDGGCSVGDVVYAPGEEFPGAGACERCACGARGTVRCARARCEPRAGCKALHRPDQCCPTYQCECEQEGRVYGNGEKLVDPLDPCRVCYCQGGEVVCRRIACFVRDDCRPRLVPGRCCPEYDNCPLRGVTTIPGVAPSMSTDDDPASSPVPSAPKENIKQEITIKEITPVSEIPVITEVKIKEVLPSPSIEGAEYSSSKSPLIVREATSEKTITHEADSYSKTETPIVVKVQPSSPSDSISEAPSEAPTKSAVTISRKKATNDSPPSKISLSTQDSINSEIYPSILTSIPTMGAPSIVPDVIPVASTTKAPIIEEDDPSLFEHNPAFPPLPDDLSGPGNHEDEIIPDQNIDGEHVSVGQEVVSVASTLPSSTESIIIREPLTTASKETSYPTQQSFKVSEIAVDLSTITEVSTTKLDATLSTDRPGLKESPMLNLRSAIPTEILNAPSYVPEEINGELDDVAEIITVAEEPVPISTSTTESVIKSEEKYTEMAGTPTETKMLPTSTIAVTDAETTTTKPIETTVYVSSSQIPQEQTTSSVLNSNIATEITSQTELSSLPIETSDQNPHEIIENIAKEKAATSTTDSSVAATTKISAPIESEVITVSRAIPSSTDNQSFENVETTEFILTSFGSSESATDAVELIKISADPEKSAAVIEPAERKKNNVLTDLINLVGDVASIGDHTDSPGSARRATAAAGISDSEELIPVNAGYKSKNNNWNVNSITEIPVKSKSQLPVNKLKVVEIEGDDTDSITDSPPPYDKVEPTTRRPIIDNVSDDMPDNKTGNKDIEIITKSYVPTINRRPTKVVMKKNNEKPISADEKTTEGAPVSVSSEVTTEGAPSSSEAAGEGAAHSAPATSTLAQ